MDFRGAARGVGRLAVVGVVGAVLTTPARAGDLKNFISDLYGGDGITLDALGHSGHFTNASLKQLNNLDSGIVNGLSSQVASPSSVSSFTFDLENAVFVRTTESLGPILAERAETIGEWKINFGVNYTEAKFKRYQGARLNNLGLEFEHEIEADDIDQNTGLPFDYTNDFIAVSIDATVEERVAAFYATLGVTSRWDVGIIVPFVVAKAKASAVASIETSNAGGVFGAHVFGSSSETCTVLQGGNACADSNGGERGGMGDVIIRTKYNFLRGDEQLVDFSALAQLAMPSGDENNLLGTGQWRPLVLLILSKDLGPFTPHVNVGYEMSSVSSKWFSVPYAVGFDLRVVEQATLAFEIIGRRGTYDNVKGSHTIDWAVGAKVNPWKTLTLIGNARFPVNNGAGVRANVIWTAGVEYTF